MNTLHKFAVLTLSAVLTVCLLAGCGASTSSTASSAASSVASSVAASEVASSAASKAQATVEFTVTAADGSVSSVLLNVTDGEKLSTALAEAGIISQEEADAGFVTTVNGKTAVVVIHADALGGGLAGGADSAFQRHVHLQHGALHAVVQSRPRPGGWQRGCTGS